VGDCNLVPEESALGIDLGYREDRTILEIGADGSAGSREFADTDQLHRFWAKADATNATERMKAPAITFHGLLLGIPTTRVHHLNRAFAPSNPASRPNVEYQKFTEL
jgi:hypothetical protein